MSTQKHGINVQYLYDKLADDAISNNCQEIEKISYLGYWTYVFLQHFLFDHFQSIFQMAFWDYFLRPIDEVPGK